MEKVYIRALALIPSRVFAVWGGIVSLKAVYDLFVGEPEANLYSAEKWQFVTQEQWLRYGGFELAYGLSLLALALLLRRYSHFLPEHVERPRKPPEFRLFD